MTRRTLLGLLGRATLLAWPLSTLALRLGRVQGPVPRAQRVRIGGPNGPVITVIPLPRNGFSGGSHLAG